MIFALFGNPVRQSLSPCMHNRALQAAGLKAYYVPVLVDDLPGAVAAIRALQIRGVSVTIPFKEEVIPLIDEIDDHALTIGSVNTIDNHNGWLKGFNTDWIGIEKALGKKILIQGKVFVLLGSGGTTRAAIYAVKKNGGEAIIVSRNKKKGMYMAAEFGCRWMADSDISKAEGDCFINTTPLGMMPHANALPITENIIRNFSFVMDVIYNPPETRLLLKARLWGAKTVSGVDMFVAQGAEQFRIWTGMNPSLRSMKGTVLAALKRHRMI